MQGEPRLCKSQGLRVQEVISNKSRENFGTLLETWKHRKMAKEKTKIQSETSSPSQENLGAMYVEENSIAEMISSEIKKQVWEAMKELKSK